jgi:uncharacterized repeat protein (TIGR01451 family)
MGAFEFVETAPSDVDLVATTVSGPATVTAGDIVEVQWTVANIGTGMAVGPWHDTIYLAPLDSAGQALPGDQVLVGQGVTLGAGQSVTVSHSVRVPGATEGSYLWRVRVNSKGDIYEGVNAANNQTDSETAVALTVPELALASPANLVFAGEGVASWFKVNQSAGQALVVDLQAAMLGGRCQLYAGYNAMPSASGYDVRSSAWNATAARVSLGAPEASRTTYLLVMPEKIGDGNLNYTLTARPAVFALSAIVLSSAGNGGRVTLPILGSGFVPGLTVSLQSADGTALTAGTVSVLDATSAEATFDLRGVTPGPFSVTAAAGGSQSTLTNAFRVTTASANGGGLKANLMLPTAVRSDRVFTGYIEYMNTGDSDVPAALVSVSEAHSNALLWVPGGSGDTNTCISFLTISPDSANPAVLRPGLTNQLAFQGIVKDASSATFILSLATPTDTSTLDTGALEVSVAPVRPHPLWQAAWTNIFSTIATWGDYVTALDGALVRAKAYGLSLSTEPEVLRFLIQEAVEQVQVAAVSGRVWLGDTNHPLGRVLVLLSKVDPSDTDTNTTFATTAWYDGSFGIRDVSPGTYSLWVDGYLPTNVMTISLPDPTNNPATNLTVILTSAAGQVFGYVTQGSAGPAVTNAVITATDEADGSTYLAMPDSTGWYAMSNLPPGTYTIELDAPEWLPLANRALTLTNGQSQLESFALSGGAEITGVVSTSAGVVVAGATVQAEWVGLSPGYGPWHGGQATTDPSGNYTISGLLPGAYGVSASTANLGVSAVTSVQLADFGAVTNVNLQLANGSLLSGTVVDAATGQTLSGVFLSLATLPPCEMTAMSDNSGRFAFTNPPAGSYPVCASLDGYMQGSVTVSIGQAGSVPVTVSLVQQGTLSGFVTRQGLPLANRTVMLVSSNGTFLEVPTDSNGGYGIQHIPPGSYNFYYGPVDGPGLFGQSLTIAATNLAVHCDFKLDAVALLGGRILGADQTTVVTNALVSLLSGSNIVAQAMTDTNGAYEFEVYQPGEYTLLARAVSSLLAPQTNVSVTASNNLLSRDFVEDTGRLAIIVSASAGGGPLSNAWVTVYPLADLSGSALSAGDSTGADGGTAFASLAPGLYRVTALLDSHAYAEQVADLSSSQTNVQMVLDAGRAVRGSVTTAGAALPNVQVVIAGQSGRPFFTTLTDSNGVYAFTSLPAGLFDIAVVPGDGFQALFTQGIDTGSTSDQAQDFALPAAGTTALSGLALDQSGQGMVSALVSLISSNGVTLAYDVTDLEEGYSLSNWPAGSFVLEAASQGRLPVRKAVTTVPGVSQTGLTLTFAAPVAAALPASEVPLGQGALIRQLGLPKPNGAGDLFTASFWEDVYSGTMGIPDPLAFINNLNIDWTQQDRLYQLAIQNLSALCNGVNPAWNRAWAARIAAVKAKNDWLSAYSALKQLNQANVDTATARAVLVAARTVKFVMSLKTLLNPNCIENLTSMPYKDVENVKNIMADISNGLTLVQEYIKQGDFNSASSRIAGLKIFFSQLGRYGVKLGTPGNLFGTLTDEASAVKEWDNFLKDVDELGEDGRQNIQRYLQAGDAYSRCLLDYKNAINQMKAAMADCKTGDDTKPKPEPVPGHTNGTQQVNLVRSVDPNYKVSLGYGASGYVLATEPILYTIEFENVSNATAAAQQVVVTDPLGPNLDWSTFQLAQISFNHVTIEVPPGLTGFSTNVHVSTDPNPVQVTALLDPDTGLATWNMLSIDEATGQLVQDPRAGFLPPNDATGSGQGYVTYSIQPRSGLASGAIITNRASIVFDVNAPILTGIATNTLYTSAPASSVTAQPVGSWDTNLVLSWAGTDNGPGIASYDVYVSINGGPWAEWLVGTTNVSAVFPANLANTYAFFSLARDHVGNQQPVPSAPDLTLAPLTVSVSGDGSLAPDYTGTGFKQVGSSYTVTAIPGFGSAFTDWTGGLTGSANSLTFTMRAGLVLQANFAPLPYAQTNGTYYGLFYPTNGITHAQSGTITLTTTARGNFSAKLQIAGGSYSISGQFDPTGVWSEDNIPRLKQSPLNVQLVMRGTDALLGSVSTADWTAAIIADRAVYDGKKSFAPQMGQYTLVIAGTNGSTLLPAGYGYGTLTVSSAGKTTFAASLADGTKVSQSAIVGAIGQCPLYIALYRGNGSLLSWLAFNGAQELGGGLAWSKPNLPTSKYYPAAFSWLTSVYGAAYHPPGKGTNVLGLTSSSLTLTLEGGNLSRTVASQFTLDANSQAKDANGKKVNVTFTPATGLFKGSVPNPDAPRKMVSFNGVVLQNQTNGWGYFLGTNQSGQVYLVP